MSDVVVSSPLVLSALSELSNASGSQGAAAMHSDQGASDSGYMAADEGSIDSYAAIEDQAEADVEEPAILVPVLEAVINNDNAELAAEGLDAGGDEGDAAHNDDDVADSEEENFEAAEEDEEDAAVINDMPQASSSSSSSSDGEPAVHQEAHSVARNLKRRRVYAPNADFYLD
ncbi:hypothetical protein ACP70R_023259 [Stipagrostis hirtigluma subsp. patula]